jgi:hypothetical protein
MPATPSPETAAPAAAGVWRARLGRHLVVVGTLCLGISLLLTALDGRGFGYKLVYSLCIGAMCTAIVDGARFAAAWIHGRVRRRRGLHRPETPALVGWRGVLPGAVLGMLFGPPAGLWIGDQLTGLRSPSLLSLDQTSSRMTLALGVLGTVVSLVVLSTQERLAAARAQAEAAQRLAAENQLRLLQSQLEPHMLFNTLANLRVLIGLDPVRAQAMLDRLIAFLRATLSASRTATHPLAAEFQHLDDYLALMAVRMGPRLAVRLDLPTELRALAVPPLLLQPLVENAIKHGLEPKVEGGRIEVSARRKGDTLELAVRDTGAGLAGPVDGGSSFGMEQVRSRLSTLFGDRASLSLQAAPGAEGGALATLQMPCPSTPEGPSP